MSAEIIEKLTVREALVVKAIASGVPESEAIKIGGWGQWAVTHPGQWLKDHPGVAATVSSMREEILFDAAEALHELIRGYAGLLIQESRLEALLGHDLGELYKDGQFRQVSDWPEVWRRHLIVELESKDFFELSQDGEQAGASKTWDKAGVITKLKRETSLSIEKQLTVVKRAQREQLELIMKHKGVDAMVAQKAGDTNILVITAETARKVAAARKRLEKVIDVTPE